MSSRASQLADRLELGAQCLAAFASRLGEAQWQTPVPGDGRKVGVIIHHVASLYPLELRLALALADGRAIIGITREVVNRMNADHAREHDAVAREAALDLLGQNSAAAATVIRGLSDAELDRAAPVSLYGGAPLTCQFMLEDHAVRHSYHHLAQLRVTLSTLRSGGTAFRVTPHLDEPRMYQRGGAGAGRDRS